MYALNSLSNVAVHMPCVNMHRAGCYQLEMVLCMHAYVPPIAMGNALYVSDCI